MKSTQTPHIVGIIQARMNATRLPGKVLMDLMGKPVLGHVIDRVLKSKRVGTLIVATSINPADDKIAEYVQKQTKLKVFRGSEEDVLERFYKCTLENKADVVVRITADNPLVDAEIIDRAVELFLSDSSISYCSNARKPSYPDGLDVEVLRFSALENAFANAKLNSEREHVCPYIWNRPEQFKLLNFEFEEDLSSWRWTLDKPRDFKLMEKIYSALYPQDPLFSFRKAIDYVKKNPELITLNNSEIRNEGYLKSLKENKKEV
jgi:spore coat polysaccharide biosynthesis protein SpsF